LEFLGTFVKQLVQNWSKTFFDNEKTFIGIWNYANNMGFILKLTLCVRLLLVYKRLQSFFLINAFINVYYNFLTFITSMGSYDAVSRKKVPFWGYKI